jgi:hypothetical protein
VAKTGGESAIVARVGRKETTAKAEKAEMPRSPANLVNLVTPKTIAMAEGEEITRHVRPRNQPPASPRSRGSPANREKQKSHVNHERVVKAVNPVVGATVGTARVPANAVSLVNPANHGPRRQPNRLQSPQLRLPRRVLRRRSRVVCPLTQSPTEMVYLQRISRVVVDGGAVGRKAGRA